MASMKLEKTTKNMECDMIRYASEVLAIIEGGLEQNNIKVRNYAELLMEKLPDDDHLKTSIKRRLDGSYKKDPELKALDVQKEKEGRK
jgi:hypothetical protein